MAARNPDTDIRASVFALVLFQVTALFCRALIDLELGAAGYAKYEAQDLSYLAVPPLLLLLAYPILRDNRCALLRLLRPDRLTLRLALAAVALGVCLRLGYWGGLVALVSSGAVRDADPGAVIGPVFVFSCPRARWLALGMFVVAVLVPLVEETMNRGLILGALLRRGRVVAVVGSAITFAILHVSSALPIAFLFGLFAAVLYVRSQTLLAPMLAHASYNAMTMLDWRCLHGFWNPVDPVPGIAVLGASLLLAAILVCTMLVGKGVTGTTQSPR